MTDRPTARPGPRVLHVSPVGFGEDGYHGGGERYPLDLATAMARIVPTTYLTFGSTPRTVEDGALHRVVLRSRGLVNHSVLNPVSERLPVHLLRADVVHLHQWESLTSNAGLLLGKAFGKKVFATDHGGYTRNLAGRLRLHRIVDGLLSVSDFASGLYPAMAARATTILGGVDPAEHHPDPSLRRGRHALFVGRLLPHKGIDVLVEALGPDDELRVVGRPYAPDFLDRLRELARGKRVTFVTDATDEQLRHEYRTARVVVLPSLHHPPAGPYAPRAELLGLTLIEAMASGTPVVCTRTGGMPQVPQDGVTGFVVEPLDRAALAAAVHRVTRAPDEVWDAMSGACVARVHELFTWDAVARRCLRAYGGDPPAG